MGCCGVTWWAIGAWVCLLVGMILHIVGFATESWMFLQTTTGIIINLIGLFSQTTCSGGVCIQTTLNSTYSQSPFFITTMALEIVALPTYILAFVLVTVYVLGRRCRNTTLIKVCAATCFLEVFLSFAGLILFLVYVIMYTPFTVFTSFGLVSIATLFAMIAGILMLFEVRENNKVSKINTGRRDMDDDLFFGH